LGFITNNSYLSGVIHRGMRRKLLETFDEIYILNLHGSSRIGEKTPEGGKDENVFDIQQGVAIVLYVKLEKSPKEKKVYYADLWGLREKKYAYLFGNDVQTTNWQELKPVTPYYFFVPKDFALQSEYEKFWKITDIFKKWSSGISTRRDHFMVGFSKNEIIQRLRLFSSNLPDNIVKVSLKLKDSKYWKVSEARQKVKNLKYDDKIMVYEFKIFDARWIFYFPDIIERGDSRFNLMKHLMKPNLALITTRKIPPTQPISAFVSCLIGDVHFISDRSYFFPLYLYPYKPEEKLFDNKAHQADRIPNFTSEFLHAIEGSLGSEPMPEEIFYYIYAILYCPTYRKRYEEFLKIDFPSVPLLSNVEVFKELSNLGKELVDLHLLRVPALDKTEIGFPKDGSNTVGKISYDEQSQRVFINKEQYFESISKEVWNYLIGAYQAMEKYLKDRKGRKLSLDEINHYMKVAEAIRLTIELQEKIDDVYRKGEI